MRLHGLFSRCTCLPAMQQGLHTAVTTDSSMPSKEVRQRLSTPQGEPWRADMLRVEQRIMWVAAGLPVPRQVRAGANMCRPKAQGARQEARVARSSRAAPEKTNQIGGEWPILVCSTLTSPLLIVPRKGSLWMSCVTELASLQSAWQALRPPARRTAATHPKASVAHRRALACTKASQCFAAALAQGCRCLFDRQSRRTDEPPRPEG